MKKLIVLALMVLLAWTAFAGTTNFDNLELSGTLAVTGATTITGALTVGGNITASAGSVTVAGDLDVTGTITAAGTSIASPYTFDGTVTLGIDGTGVDLLCYGDTLSANMLWDYTADELIFDGAATAFFGDSNIVYFGDGGGDADRDFALYYDSNDLILLPRLAADGFNIGTNALPVSITQNGTFTVGANGEGHDVVLYGDTAATYAWWDESTDDLILQGAVAGLVMRDEAQLRFGDHASGDIYFNWDASKFEMEGIAASSTWNIGAVGNVINTTNTGTFEVVGASTFDAITSVGNLNVDGTTALIDGSTSVRGVSAGFTSLEAPANRFGVSDTVYTNFAVNAVSGNLTVTHTGGTTNLVTWTAGGGFDLVGAIALDAITAVGNFSVDGTTAIVDGSTSVRGVSAGFTSLEAPDIRFGYDASDYMKLVTTTGTGALAITHVGGSAPDVTWAADSWTLTGGFEIVGTSTLDDFSASGLADLDGGIAVDTSNFTVSGTTGDIVTAADIDVKGGDITNTTVGGGLDLEATAAAADTATVFVEISGTTAAHATLTGTDIFLDISPTIGIPTGTAANVHLIDLTFSSPAWATAVTSNLRGIYFAPTIGAATLGTNTVALIDVAAITGDDTVSLYGIRFGALTGTGATENAIEIGAGWDAGINTASPITLTGTAGDIDANDNITCGDLIIDEAAGGLDFSGATSATISTSVGTCDIVLDSADDTAGSDKTYVSITGSVPAHLTNTPTSVFLDITPTVGIPTVNNIVNLVDLTFTTPIYATAVTSTYRGLYFAPTIGAATLGTNVVALMDVAAITGDDTVSLYGVRFGALTGTGATENAIEIGAGWDAGFNSASPVTLTGTAGDLDAHDNITCGDLAIDEATGVLSFTGATSATISTSTAATELVIDVADAAAGADMNYVEITGSVPAHATNTPTTRFLTIDPTIAIPTVANTVNLVDMVFTTPIYGTAVTSTLRGIYFDPTIGASTLGTNNLALIDVAAIGDGDANQNIYVMRIGAMTQEGGETANAIDIGAGWDAGVSSSSPVALTNTTCTMNTNPVVLCHRHRVTVAEINAGHELLAAIAGRTYRMVSCVAIAYGGAVGTVTTVDLLGTQAAGGVKLVAYAQASLTQSAVLTSGGTGAAVLADGASYTACDADTAITIGKTGGAADTATGVDFILQYVIE